MRRETKAPPPWTRLLHAHGSSCLGTVVLTAPGQATAAPSRPAGKAAGGNLCKGDKDLETPVICTRQRQSRGTAKKYLVVCLFYFFLLVHSVREKPFWGGGAGGVCLFVSFFHLLALVLLPHARIKPPYKGKYGAESLSCYTERGTRCTASQLSPPT